MRVRDGLVAQLRDLSKQKPRGKADENLIAEAARLQSALTVAKDDLVSFHPLVLFLLFTLGVIQSACKLRLTGINDELKHLDKELKKNTPEVKKVHFNLLCKRLELTADGRH